MLIQRTNFYPFLALNCVCTCTLYCVCVSVPFWHLIVYVHVHYVVYVCLSVCFVCVYVITLSVKRNITSSERHSLKINPIKMNHIWTQISFDTLLIRSSEKQRFDCVKKEKFAVKSQKVTFRKVFDAQCSLWFMNVYRSILITSGTIELHCKSMSGTCI